MVNIKDIEIYKGDDYEVDYTLKKDGSPMVLSDYIVSSQLKIHDTHTAFDIATSGDKLTMSLTNLVTTGLKSGVGSYDIEFKHRNTGKVFKLIKGRVFIKKEVTV